MSSMTENDLLQFVRSGLADVIAPGADDFLNDGARLPPPAAGQTRVVTADTMVEGQHFQDGLGPPASVGHRLVARNLSDLAAMGASPVGFVWTLTLGSEADPEWVEGMVEGAAEIARATGLYAYGGDLSKSDGATVLSLTAFGDVAGPPLSRRGASIGDRVWLSRAVGAAQVGLLSLQGELSVADEARAHAERAHLFPAPELRLGSRLVGRATACLDVSDGLITDLTRLAQASGVGVSLRTAEACVDKVAADVGLGEAVDSGDDYALIFTMPRDQTDAIEPGAIDIGEITEGGIVVCEGGSLAGPLEPKGWDPFAVPDSVH